jgi:excisionase family DNA binding protein
MRALIDRAQSIPPMLLTPDEVAVTLRLAPTSIRHMIQDGQLRCVRVRLGGKRQVRRIPVAEIQAFVDRLTAEQMSGQ